MRWARLRREVYARDEGRCQVCLLKVGRAWDAGHLVDRCVGGAAALENLVLMCQHCNRTRKPIHRTLEEAIVWLAEQRDLARNQPRDTWRQFYDALFGRAQPHAMGETRRPL